MRRHSTKRKSARWMGVFLLTATSGCINLPTWKIPTPEPCRKAENAWGCAVDHVNHQSPIDQPWCDSDYRKRGVYRVAAYGIIHQSPEAGDRELYDSDSSSDRGDMKPPIYGEEGPTLNKPE